MTADIIVLMVIAIFIALRVRSVLGKKMGNEDPSEHLRDFFNSQQDEKVIQLPSKKHSGSGEEAVADEENKLDEYEEKLPASLKRVVRDIRKVDETFHVGEFLEGAKVAFEMIMESFEEGDKETLEGLLSEDIYKAFAKAIDDRENADEREHVTLVSIVSAEVDDIRLLGRNICQIAVRFESEQIRVTRDKKGNIVGDSSGSTIENVEDRWVFERDLRSSNPNWVVIENG